MREIASGGEKWMEKAGVVAAAPATTAATTEIARKTVRFAQIAKCE